MEITEVGKSHEFKEEKICSCGTKFIFTNEDVRCWDESGPYVRCPVCGREHFLNGGFPVFGMLGMLLGIPIITVSFLQFLYYCVNK